jgi:N-acetyl-anhydromuramoyl-L-alanine amidase
MVGPLRMGADGWLAGVRLRPSANFDARPAGMPIDLLVLHNISLPPGRFGDGRAERLFSNALDAGGHPFLELLAGLRVSAHFLIARDGHICQFVSCLQRAWHAGASVFEGRAGCNDHSIGIELEGTDFTPFDAAQYDALAQLTLALRKALPLRAVRGHSHIAPGRKTDPGPMFDWRRFADQASLPASWLPDGLRARE